MNINGSLPLCFFATGPFSLPVRPLLGVRVCRVGFAAFIAMVRAREVDAVDLS